jgi:hypothetical protein
MGARSLLPNGIEDIALLMDHTPLTGGGRKERSHSGEQALMPIRHEQIDLGGLTLPQIVQQATPSIFVFFRTGTQRQDLFVSLQIDTQGR